MFVISGQDNTENTTDGHFLDTSAAKMPHTHVHHHDRLPKGTKHSFPSVIRLKNNTECKAYTHTQTNEHAKYARQIIGKSTIHVLRPTV